LKHLPLNKIAVAIAGRVHTPEQILLRTARNKTGKTQQAFAELITPPPLQHYVIGSRAGSVHQGLKYVYYI